eukprot:232671-Chlamydomonas_euryale.AAC.1
MKGGGETFHAPSVNASAVAKCVGSSPGRGMNIPARSTASIASVIAERDRISRYFDRNASNGDSRVAAAAPSTASSERCAGASEFL